MENDPAGEITTSQKKMIQFSLAIAILKTNSHNLGNGADFYQKHETRKKIAFWQQMCLSNLSNYQNPNLYRCSSRESFPIIDPQCQTPASLNIRHPNLLELEALALSGVIDGAKTSEIYSSLLKRIKSNAAVSQSGSFLHIDSKTIEIFSKTLMQQVLFGCQTNIDDGNTLFQNVVQVLSKLASEKEFTQSIFDAQFDLLSLVLDKISQHPSGKIWEVEVHILERLYFLLAGLEIVTQMLFSQLLRSKKKRNRTSSTSKGSEGQEELLGKLALLLAKSSSFKLAQSYCWRIIVFCKNSIVNK